MSEQFNLTFDAPEPSPFESMSIEELKKLYREKVGKTPRVGRNNREHLIWAIQNPDEEFAKLRILDMEEDQENRRNNKL